ncbi:MAG: hypothetical protein IJI73_09265 [Kiritimatiellae bacterium]|nr:hypothetical protein [Kiritimatiellia bacterium]
MEVSDGLTLTLGGTTIGLIVKELLAWHRSRNQKTRVEPTPLPVTTEKTPKYVTVQEFNKHVEDNARDHENMFARLNANDKLTSKLEGILEGIREDLSAIKNKLFKTR